jgi:cation transport ATPase
MPTRKQRRRRAKEQRHEYEYVWEDAEGNALDPDDVPEAPEAQGKRATASPAREPQAPSWRRTLKRSLIFAPIMLVTVMLLSSNLSTGEQITQAAIIVAIFVPFSYFLDTLFWRSYKRRVERRARDARGS